MKKRIFVAGLAGAVALLVWTFIWNGVLGFSARLSMKQVPNEREVYAMLKSAITEPGRYLCNPAVTSEGRFPDNEPVFGIQYSGAGHEAAGLGAILSVLQFLIVPTIGAWLVSVTSENYRSRSANRALFLAIIGVLVAIAADLGSYGIGGSPPSVACLYAARTIVTWAIIGLVIASLTRPERPAQPAS